MDKVKVVNFWKEFKGFALQGNMIDVAVGIVLGTAFNDLVKSLVSNVIMPPVGKLLGNVSFANLYVNLSDREFGSLAKAELAGAPVVKYGLFITNLLDFFILALTIFVVLKVLFRLRLFSRSKGR